MEKQIFGRLDIRLRDFTIQEEKAYSLTQNNISSS